MIDFDRIVAYGCSFTEGHELLDYQRMSHLGSEKEIDRIKRSYKSTIECIQKHILLPDETYTELTEKTKKLSWVNQVAEHFGVECVNKAIAGNSLEQILFQIMTDRISGETAERDLILVGVPCSNRWMYFNREGDPTSVVLGYDGSWPSKKFHLDFVYEIANDEFMTWNFYKTLKTLDLLSQSNNIKLCCMLQTVEHMFYRNPKFDLDYTFSCFIDKDFSFSSIVNFNDASKIHAWYHPKYEHHVSYAQHIIKKITND